MATNHRQPIDWGPRDLWDEQRQAQNPTTPQSAASEWRQVSRQRRRNQTDCQGFWYPTARFPTKLCRRPESKSSDSPANAQTKTLWSLLGHLSSAAIILSIHVGSTSLRISNWSRAKRDESNHWRLRDLWSCNASGLVISWDGRWITVTYEIAVRYEIADPLKNLTGQKIRG
jgi:hypothetical protein